MRIALLAFVTVCAVAAAFALLTSAASAAEPLPPERAPPAQQAAPPDKIGPPLHAEQPPAAKIRRNETTGASPKSKDGTVRRQDRSHPAH